MLTRRRNRDTLFVFHTCYFICLWSGSLLFIFMSIELFIVETSLNERVSSIHKITETGLLSHFSFGFKVQMERMQPVVMAPKNPFFHPSPSSTPPLSSYLPPICGAGWDSNPRCAAV